MCRSDFVTAHRNLDVPLAVEEMVDRMLAVPAGDECRRRTELVQPFGQSTPVLHVEPGERLRLAQVRRHDGRERKEAPDERVDGVVLEQLRAGARDHHGIEDERDMSRVQDCGHGLDDRGREEHPGLRRVDADVVEDGVELRAHERRRQRVHVGDRGRVLRGQGNQHGHPVTAGGGERLQVRLDPCTTARIGRGNRQCAWNDLELPSPVRTGSGSAGVISAP